MKNEHKPDPYLTDEENPEITEEVLAEAKSVAELLPDLAKQAGRPKSVNPKQPITIRLNPEVLQYFKDTGKGWQTRINEILEEYVAEHR